MPKNQSVRIIDQRRGGAISGGGVVLPGHTHDDRYVLLTTYTAADVLAKLLTVDGSGTGLDADTVDGQHAADFAASSHGHDHGALAGLADDDHTQYLLATGARAGASSQAQQFTNGLIAPNLRPATDSTAALQLLDASGNHVLTVDTTNKRVGINNQTPLDLLDMIGDGAVGRHRLRTYAASATAGAELVMLRARGTLASPAQVKAGDVLGGYYFRAYGLTNFAGSGANLGAIRARAAEDITDTSGAIYLDFQLAASGSTSRTTATVLQSDRIWRIYNALAAAASVADTAAVFAADQQSRAGDSAFHVFGEAGRSYSFGTQAQLGGGLALPIVTKTASGALALSEHTVLADAASGAITLTLPTAASAYNSATGVGQTYIVKKIDGSANAVTIDGSGAETIDGAATQALAAQWAALRIQSNGAAWYII